MWEGEGYREDEIRPQSRYTRHLLVIQSRLSKGCALSVASIQWYWQITSVISIPMPILVV